MKGVQLNLTQLYSCFAKKCCVCPRTVWYQAVLYAQEGCAHTTGFLFRFDRQYHAACPGNGKGICPGFVCGHLLGLCFLRVCPVEKGDTIVSIILPGQIPASCVIAEAGSCVDTRCREPGHRVLQLMYAVPDFRVKKNQRRKSTLQEAWRFRR